MGTNVNAILPLSECKAQKLKISDTEYTDNTALIHVHSEFQFPFQIPLRAFQKPLCRSRTLCKDYNIICVTDNRDSSAGHFLVIFVEIDICEQGTEWAALGRAFLRLYQQSVFHDSGLDSFHQGRKWALRIDETFRHC